MTFASPAHAGMYPLQSGGLTGAEGFPRTRGDVPYAPAPKGFVGWLPPHTRGCTHEHTALEDPMAASPAHAGMYLNLTRRQRFLLGFPRTRGDVPAPGNSDARIPSLPPHTRGCTRTELPRGDAHAASPAHAGMYPSPFPMPPLPPRFPRTRGDVPELRVGIRRRDALPPHTRGCTQRCWKLSDWVPASPAHAGMYPWFRFRFRLRTSFPRTRGDVPETFTGVSVSSALPPHTRGCTPAPVGRHPPETASPAHAGMYPLQEPVRPPASRFPAHAGMYPGSHHPRTDPQRFPRTRGDVPSPGGRYSLRPSFPRTRGDVPYVSCVVRRRWWLPPHTRGCTPHT